MKPEFYTLSWGADGLQQQKTPPWSIPDRQKQETKATKGGLIPTIAWCIYSRDWWVYMCCFIQTDFLSIHLRPSYDFYRISHLAFRIVVFSQPEWVPCKHALQAQGLLSNQTIWAKILMRPKYTCCRVFSENKLLVWISVGLSVKSSAVYEVFIQ